MPRIHERQYTVGMMIEYLAACKPDKPVYFDFCGLKPDGLSSYRGYYEDVAIGWTAERGDTVGLKAGDLLACFKSTINTSQTGYKGGSFFVDKDTAVWVSNWGECDGTAVVGMNDEGWCIVIETAHVD